VVSGRRNSPYAATSGAGSKLRVAPEGGAALQEAATRRGRGNGRCCYAGGPRWRALPHATQGAAGRMEPAAAAVVAMGGRDAGGRTGLWPPPVISPGRGSSRTEPAAAGSSITRCRSAASGRTLLGAAPVPLAADKGGLRGARRVAAGRRDQSCQEAAGAESLQG
jgi:hypothetical protein